MSRKTAATPAPAAAALACGNAACCKAFAPAAVLQVQGRGLGFLLLVVSVCHCRSADEQDLERKRVLSRSEGHQGETLSTATRMHMCIHSHIRAYDKERLHLV